MNKNEGIPINNKRKLSTSKEGIKVKGRNKVNEAADAAITAFVQSVNQTGVEGLRKEFAELKTYVSPTGTYTKFMENEARNRFKDIVCLDASRVVLTLNVPPETDYIHANWIKLEGVEQVFIAAQGPLENTVSDFWRMCHQENVSTVLMLCKTEEDQKQKCFPYWPAEQGSYKNYGTMFVNNKKTEQEDRFAIYTLELLPEGCSNSVVIKLIQMNDWPDLGMPASGMSVLRLLKYVPKNKFAGPCVVHCSAGVGRTGSIVLVEAAISRLWKGQPVDMKKLFCEIRDQRAAMVRTESQYVFAHLAVLCYINAKMVKHKNAVLEFYKQFQQVQFN